MLTPPRALHFRVLYVLRRWMDLHNQDFVENHNALLNSLLEWTDGVSTQGVEVVFRKFREWAEERVSDPPFF